MNLGFLRPSHELAEQSGRCGHHGKKATTLGMAKRRPCESERTRASIQQHELQLCLAAKHRTAQAASTGLELEPYFAGTRTLRAGKSKSNASSGAGA